MIRFGLICVVGLILASCASVKSSDDALKIVAQDVEPVFTVRAASSKSPNLFAIEDPLIQAVEARARGDYTDSYKKFYAAWLATPGNEDVIVGFTNMALKTNHTQMAYKAISKLDLDPDAANPDLLAAQVLAEISVGKSPDVELRLNQALERSTEDSRLWNALGKFHDSRANWLQAQDCYIQASKTGGSKSGLNNNLGMSLLMQGQTQAAISKFEQAVELDSKITLYDNNRRLALALEGNFDKAVNGLDDNRAADILNDAGYIANIRSETKQAKALFNAAILQSGSHHAKAHGNLQRLISARHSEQGVKTPKS